MINCGCSIGVRIPRCRFGDLGSNSSRHILRLRLFSKLFDCFFSQSLVPGGSVEKLLATYDSKRRELPPPVTVWEWGWTKSAETWNGRVAMLAFLMLLALEVTSGEGILHKLGLLS